MKKDFISIIMPTYNREKTIERAIKSVLNQTYSNFELIIVDDCSQDNTEKIVQRIKDSRIKYIKLSENKGACYARNYGINISKGNILSFQDSDDEWLPKKLEKQLINMKKNKSKIDFCSCKKFINKEIKIIPEQKQLNIIKKYGFEKALRFGNFTSTQLFIIEKKCLLENLFDERLPRLQDYDLILRLSEKNKISYTNEPLVNIYVQNDSITNSNEKLIKAIKIMERKDYSYKNILLSYLYENLAFISKKEKRYYYLKSIKNYFKFKTIIKFLIKY